MRKSSSGRGGSGQVEPVACRQALPEHWRPSAAAASPTQEHAVAVATGPVHQDLGREALCRTTELSVFEVVTLRLCLRRFRLPTFALVRADAVARRSRSSHPHSPLPPSTATMAPSLISRFFSSRFLSPYYLLNAILIGAFVLFRIRDPPAELATVDPMGFTKESQIYFCAGLMYVTRALSAPTLDVYLSSVLLFTRVAIIVVLFFMSPALAAVFVILFTFVGLVFPQPRATTPAAVSVLNRVSFAERVTRNKHKTITVVWLHAPWSPRCTGLAPLLNRLVAAYDHPRLRWAKLDASVWTDVAADLDVSTAATSQQLPTVVVFSQGKELARLPTLGRDGGKLEGLKMTYASLVEGLGLDERLRVAEAWEEEARNKLSKAQAREAKKQK